MKLSTRARYSLQCMIALSRLSVGGAPVSLEVVSQETGLPKRYLEQLVISLRNGKLLRSVSGRAGGYMLARPAEQIWLGEIVEAVIGPVNIVDCVCEPEHCYKADQCESRLIYLLINRSINRVLNEYSLADLSDRERLGQVVKALDVEVFGGSLRFSPDAPSDLFGCTAGQPG